MTNSEHKTLALVDLQQQAYRPVWDLQRRLQKLRIAQEIPDTLIFVEQFLRQRGIEIVHVDRGGDVTYHGPGQLVGYPVFDLHQHQKSVSWYMRQLEMVFIDVLQKLNISARRVDDYTGVWVGDEKIVALGVRISRWVTMHGFAFNVSPVLDDYAGIIPCGIFHRGVTALDQLVSPAPPMAEVKNMVADSFQKVFGFSRRIRENVNLQKMEYGALSLAAVEL